MASDLDSAAELVRDVVGRNRGFGIHRGRADVLTIVIEALDPTEQEQIEHAVGEPVTIIVTGRRPRRMPKRPS